MSTIYKVLDVVQDASHFEIKKAYHRTMLKFHPDKNPNIPDNEKAKHEAIAKEANHAWEILGDPRRRSEYDEAQHHPAKRQKHDNSNPECGEDRYRPNSALPPAPPRRYGRSLGIRSHGWSMTIELEGDYQPYEWGPNTVFCEEGRIFIYMKIRTSQQSNTQHKPDVKIGINETPDMRPIHKMKSLYKHRMQPVGLDEQLLVTVFLAPGAAHRFTVMRQYNARDMAFRFWWYVHADTASSSPLKPALEVITHATCLHFFTRRPTQTAMFVPKPGHPDNPRSVLLKDSDLKPGSTLKFAGMVGEERSWIPLKRALRGDTEMFQVAACAWQDLGQEKGEREKTAEDASQW